MDYEIAFGNYAGIFALPTDVADRYINEAAQADFKLLVYIFRRSGSPFDALDACNFLKISSDQLKSSLDFWADRKIITYKTSDKTSVKVTESSTAQREQEKTKAQVSARRVLDMPVQYGQEEIARKSQGNPEIKFLLEAVPDQLGRLISPSECSILIYLYEGAGLPADVIIMLIGYCVSSGKGNMRYIEKMAVSWAEDGIDSHEKAENKICELEARRGFDGKVRSIMGISDRAPSAAEKQYMASWDEWKMPPELVKLAYDIGVSRTGKISFPYINKILNTWHEKGFKTVEQAQSENKNSKVAGNKSPSYDIDEYVRLSLKRLNKE